MILEVLNIAGVAAFSISGVLARVKKKLDILGVVVLGIITAFGGGILRDVILNSVPASVVNERDMYIAIVISILAYALFKKMKNYFYLIRIFDAAGLALFTIIGAERGMSAGLGLLGTVLMATLTGVAGGAIRDVLIMEIPFILKEEVYALLSIIGAVVFWIGINYFDLDKSILSYIIIIMIFAGRMIAVKYNLHLPRRTIEENIEKNN